MQRETLLKLASKNMQRYLGAAREDNIAQSVQALLLLIRALLSQPRC